MTTESDLSAAREAVRRHDRLLLKDPNVNAVGVGRKIVNGSVTDTVCVRIYVTRNLPADPLPGFLDAGDGNCVVTDIVEAGPFHRQDNPTLIPPAQPGLSICAERNGALGGIGTFGAVVVDDEGTHQSLILGNNHVLASDNQNPIGTRILQPGRVPMGTYQDYTIATLLRFVQLQQDVDNVVDGALALPLDPAIISPTPRDGVPTPSPQTRAVALHCAGDGQISIGNPIDAVLAQLGVQFPLEDSDIGATIGMPVQKAGYATGRTTGNVDATNVTCVIDGRTFVNQITFSNWNNGVPVSMTASGDSGSLYVQA